MNTILVTTDFSDASRNAAVYGSKLARALNAKIILFNAYKVPAAAPGLAVSISAYDVMMQTDKKLSDEAELLDPKREVIETTSDEGVAEDAIINIANEKKVNFIIAGMKGSGKTLQWIFGSTATSLIKKSNIPVIIVPEEAQFTNPEVILYASDVIPDPGLHHLDKIKPITDAFESKLYVVRVVKDEAAEIFERLHSKDRLSEELKKPGVSFHFPVDADVSHALHEFIQEHHVDVLVMTPHKHEWLELFFRKSETKDMIFHTRIPVLVMHEDTAAGGDS